MFMSSTAPSSNVRWQTIAARQFIKLTAQQADDVVRVERSPAGANDGDTLHRDNTLMVFDVSADGSDGAPLVLMLHGFGVSRFFWNAQVHAVGRPATSQ
jgi:hypothetical protein